MTGGGEEEAIPIFARRATGLVREIGPFGLMTITMSYAIGGGINFLSVKNGALYPGSHVGLAFFIAGIPVLLVAFCYAFLAIMMPRSGGSYIFVSRIISPIWGFLISWVSFLGGWLLVGIIAYYDVFFWGTMLWCIGAAFKSKGLMDAAVWLMRPENSLWLGIVFLIIAFIICSLRITTLIRIIQALWIIPVIGSIMIVTTYSLNWGLAATRPEEFKRIWDSIMGEGSYDEVMNIALAHGFDPATYTTFSWESTWNAAIYAGIWAYGSPATPPTAVAGEVKIPTKTQMVGTVLGTFFIMAYYVSVTTTMFAACDPFIRAYTFNFLNGYDAEYTITPKITPNLPFFAGILTGNLGLAAFYAASAAIWLWNDIPPFYLYLTRFVFAWAFDRIFPTFFAKVHPTLRSPIYANLLILILSIASCIMCWGWWIYKVFWFLDQVACWSWIFPDMFVALAAVLAPVAREDIFKESPLAGVKFLGIPVKYWMAVIGICAFFGMGLFVFLVQGTFYASGVATVRVTADLLLVVGWLTLGVIIFSVYWYYNQARGIPVHEIYKALPPA